MKEVLAYLSEHWLFLVGAFVTVATAGGIIYSWIKKIINKAGQHRAKKKHARQIKKAAKQGKQVRTWIVGLRLAQTGLIYQRAVVKCSEEQLALARYVRPAFYSCRSISDFFEPELIIECSEEVAWDAWDDSEFDIIIDI